MISANVETWKAAHRVRYTTLIGDRVIVRFSDGTFILGTVVPAPGRADEAGSRPRHGEGVWINLDNGTEWVAPDANRQRVRSLGPAKGGLSA